MYLMEPYDDALLDILDDGIKKGDRTGIGCISVAGLQRVYPLHNVWREDENGTWYHFPIVTGRRLYPKAVFAELLWFISGSTRNQDLEALGAKFWGKWCDENNPKYVALRKKWDYEPGDFGPIYGWQLRNFGGDYQQYRKAEANLKYIEEHPESVVYSSGEELRSGYQSFMESAKGIDQLKWMVDVLRNDPFGSEGRRCLFSLWNPADLLKMALPPCHYTYQAIPDGDGGLTGILTQRSCDFPVGVPANIQFYSALTIMLAQQANMKPRAFVHETHDSHIYLDQVEQVRQYLNRVYAESRPDSPKLCIRKAKDIFSYKMDDFLIADYNPLDKIDIPVAV